MASQAQVRANQENAQKSTGPKSAQGKQRSSENATTHGIFSKIPILPGEDQVRFKTILDHICQSYKPQDAMEAILIERMTIAQFKLERLGAAEAARIKINMTEDKLTHSLNMALEVDYFNRFTFNELSPEFEELYQFYLKVAEEFKVQGEACKDFSIDMIENNMPCTFELLKLKPKEYKGTWEIFITRPDTIQLAMREIKETTTKHLERYKPAHTAHYLWEDIKALERLPKGRDMEIFNKYRTQFDNDFYRAMKMLKEYRNNKARIIEGEIVEDIEV